MVRTQIKRSAAILGLALFLTAWTAQSAFAAADPVTGIDWVADLTTPTMDSVKPALLAGLTMCVLFFAVSGGMRVFRRVTGTH